MSSRGLLLVVLVVSVTVGLSEGPAMAGDGTPPASVPGPAGPRPAVVVVVGDSISSTAPGARYRPAGVVDERPEVWWSLVVNAAGLRPTSVVDLAVGGTGYVRRGPARTSTGTQPCGGTVFVDRLPALEQARPDVVIVAGGRNDGYLCSASSSRVRSSSAQQRAAIATFHDRLAQVVRRLGLPPAHVLVTAPWGSADQDGRATIAAVVETQARRHGFTYVPLSPLDPSRLLDTTHPNDAGVREIAAEFTRSSGIDQALGLTSPRPVRAARLVAGVCSRSERRDARTRTWGRTGAEGFVAARSTRARRAPLAPATSDGWLAGSLSAGARVVAQPRPGDVAWWPSQPWPAGASREHVATVLRSTSGGAVVAEVRSGSRCERTGYRDAAMPRAYVRLPGVSGTPRGAATVRSVGSRAVRVAGWTADPDAAPGARTRIRVRATVGGRAVGTLVKASTYRFDVVLRLERQARGKRVKVVVEALNSPRTHGRAASRLATRTLRLAR